MNHPGAAIALTCIGIVASLDSIPVEAQSEMHIPTEFRVAVDPPFTFESLDHWREYVLPSAKETKWCDIPWRQSFAEAVKDSQIEGKPILLWAMNGHPMGCT